MDYIKIILETQSFRNTTAKERWKRIHGGAEKSGPIYTFYSYWAANRHSNKLTL
jgi:hypothetical protein